MKIDCYFVANLSKLMLQKNLDKWLNGHHKDWNDAHDRRCFEELCKTASEKKKLKWLLYDVNRPQFSHFISVPCS